MSEVIRIVCQFDGPQKGGDQAGLIPVLALSTVVVRRSRRAFPEAVLYRCVASRERGIELGAVQVDRGHVGWVKNLNICRFHERLPDGNLGAELKPTGSGWYGAADGRSFHRDDIEFVFFNSSRLATDNHRALKGQDVGYAVQAACKRLGFAGSAAVDTSTSAGQWVARLAQIYRANSRTSSLLKRPRFWVRTQELPRWDQQELDQVLWDCLANQESEGLRYTQQLATLPGQVVKVVTVTYGQDWVEIKAMGPDGHVHEWVYPSYAEVLVEKGQEVPYGSDLVWLLPPLVMKDLQRVSVGVAGAGEQVRRLRERFPQAVGYAQQLLTEQNARYIYGRRSYNAALLAEWPTDADPRRDVYAQGDTTPQLAIATWDDLVGRSGLVAWDLYHHHLCRPEDAGSDQHDQASVSVAAGMAIDLTGGMDHSEVNESSLVLETTRS